MNYRHAFHAGNFADVMKHVVFVRILEHLRGKPAAFRVIDTHAGRGLYDFGGPEAERTDEWRNGIGKCETPFSPAVEELLAPYRSVLAEVRARHGTQAYPGSPAILREMLRPQDRAILIEKHPADGDFLTSRFNTVANLKVLRADGWAAIGGLVPPKERRGLVLIDPPYEEPDELSRASARLAALNRRWPTGIMALWYPIKGAAAVNRLYDDLSRAVPVRLLRLDLLIEPKSETNRLIGCGLAVLNPPWRIAEDSETILPALANRLGSEGSWRIQAYPASAGSGRRAPPG